MTPSLAVSLLLLVAGPAAYGQTLQDLMAEGKAETDLGRYDVAIRALTAVTDDRDATPKQRAEGLVRLGVARQLAGDPQGALESFERASEAPGLDQQTKALLVQALGGALPSPERWAQVWSQVSFTLERSEPKRPALAIVWPDVPRAHAYGGRPVSINLEDGDLGSAFRLFADITGFNVVVFPGVRGRVTYKTHDEPWDRALDHILAANGLAYQWEDNVVLIARPEQLGKPRRFSGQRIQVNFNERELREVLAELAAAGGVAVDVDPAVAGHVTLRLTQVRWDQAFEMTARVNGLDWTRNGDTLKVFPRGAR